MSLVGTQLGSYTLVSQLGEGGMGVVYVGENASLGRRVAIKVLHPEFASQPAIVNRFFNEARAANLIRHPSIVDIHDFGHAADGSAYIIMELLDGESLARRLHRDGTLPPAVAVRVVTRIASALGAAHTRGIIHRDLKPDNVILVPDPDHPGEERVKILDFGIAKLAEDGSRGGATKTGAVLGTPLYMSPEQADGARNVDPRADIYALGVVTYEALCGRPPFVAEGYGHVMAMHLMQAPPP
ncbi:MAG TPA: serine/threonine-protein kinase, partial [Myxococcota bacterium]|nr:serine/threonine-protein kinase [Myxococcota bacterium]